MFRFLAEIFIRSNIKKRALKEKRAFLAWDKVEKIALILEQEDSLNKSEIDKFIQDCGKYTEVFYIEPKAKEAAYGDWHCFTKKQRSLLGLPNSEAEKSFANKNFDVVIHTCSEKNLFARALFNSLHAQMHCSSVSSFTEADLIVKRAENEKLLSCLTNFFSYLKMIKTKIE